MACKEKTSSERTGRRIRQEAEGAVMENNNAQRKMQRPLEEQPPHHATITNVSNKLSSYVQDTTQRHTNVSDMRANALIIIVDVRR